jgi:hypothetical protein
VAAVSTIANETALLARDESITLVMVTVENTIKAYEDAL